ncbi:MAG TPA: tyrosine-type recombinase/integrase, partial [Candidatus Binataceae bacterium]|nr:tyrosine-type recombinase/integrase [Candidatus Binataceae bacterium]
PRSKSGEARRVPMNDEVRKLLRDLPSRLKTGWVFPSQRGRTPVNAKNFVRRVFLPALKAAKIADFRWHDLRHTFITRLAENPAVSEQTITALAGHVSRRMLERYSHIRRAAKQAAIASLERPDFHGGGAQNWARSPHGSQVRDGVISEKVLN